MSSSAPSAHEAWIDDWLRAWSEGDPERLLGFYHADAYYQDPACPGGLQGHAAIGAYFRKLLKAYPGWEWRRESLFPAAPDGSGRTGLTLRWRANFAEAWRQALQGLDWIEMQDGLITRNEVYFDARNWPEKAWVQRLASEWGTVELSTERGRLDRERLLALLRDTYWAADLTPERLAQRIETSLCFGLYHEAQLIGFARALTDYHTFAYLADVIIDPDWRGRGLGQWMMAQILAHPQTIPMRRWLLRTRDAHGLYHKFGFAPLASLDNWLEIWEGA